MMRRCEERNFRNKFLEPDLSELCEAHGIELVVEPPYVLGMDDMSYDCQTYFKGDLRPIMDAIFKTAQRTKAPVPVRNTTNKWVNAGKCLKVDTDAWLKKQSDRDNDFYAISSNTKDPQELDDLKTNKEVDWLIQYVPPNLLDGLADGMALLPIGRQVALKKYVLSKAGSAGAMAGARRAIEKIDKWLSIRFGSDHGFKVKEAVVCWFLLDIQDTAVKAVRAGLVFAANHYKLPIDVVGEAGLSMVSAPTMKRGPALSTTVRVLHAAECLAAGIDPSGKKRRVSKAVQYLAAVKCATCWATLRSVDARRSTLVKIEGSYFIGLAFAQKSKKNTEMRWAAPMASISGHNWWVVLFDVWKHAKSLHTLPTLYHANQIFECETMSLEVATPTQMTRLHRRIFAWAFEVDESVMIPMKGHSDRHFLPNCGRLSYVDKEKMEAFGRWKPQKVMALLYSQEVQFITVIRLIYEMAQIIQKSIRATPILQWQLFGDWEKLAGENMVALKDALSLSNDVVHPESDYESDDGSSEDERDGAADWRAEQFIDSSTLPEGWVRHDRTTAKGRSYAVYIENDGSQAYSVIETWRRHNRRPLIEKFDRDTTQAGLFKPSPDLITSAPVARVRKVHKRCTRKGLASGSGTDDYNSDSDVCPVPGCTKLPSHTGLCNMPFNRNARRKRSDMTD